MGRRHGAVAKKGRGEVQERGVMICVGGVSGCLVRQSGTVPGLHVRDTLRPGLGMLKPPAQGRNFACEGRGGIAICVAGSR